MNVRYYHNLATRTVYEVPEVFADSKYTKHKRPQYEGCSVTVTIKVLSASNYRERDGRWAQPVLLPCSEDYDFRDLPDDAKRWFQSMHIDNLGDQISKEEFERLAKEYQAEADANDPPSQ